MTEELEKELRTINDRDSNQLRLLALHMELEKLKILKQISADIGEAKDIYSEWYDDSIVRISSET